MIPDPSSCDSFFFSVTTVNKLTGRIPTSLPLSRLVELKLYGNRFDRDITIPFK